nr:unnamed protein product [Digitaria exilis]
MRSPPVPQIVVCRWASETHTSSPRLPRSAAARRSSKPAGHGLRTHLVAGRLPLPTTPPDAAVDPTQRITEGRKVVGKLPSPSRKVSCTDGNRSQPRLDDESGGGGWRTDEQRRSSRSIPGL